jgi:hypothetical protein
MMLQRLLEFKIHKDRDGEWDFEDDLGDDVEFRFKFALHTGTESPEVRDHTQHIQQFVGTLPQKIANRLKENTKGRTEKEIYTATL